MVFKNFLIKGTYYEIQDIKSKAFKTKKKVLFWFFLDESKDIESFFFVNRYS